MTIATVPPTKKSKIAVMRKRPVININGAESDLTEEDRTTDILRGRNSDRHLKVYKNFITEAPR